VADSKIYYPKTVLGETGDGFSWAKTGRVVYCAFSKNGVTAAADAKIVDIPSGYDPIFNTSTLDTLHNGDYRIGFSKDTHTVYALTALTNVNIRGSITYISNE